MPAAANLSAHLAQAIQNQQTLALLDQQGQEFSSTGQKIATADIKVENLILSDVSTLTKQANATLTSQIKAAQAQLKSAAAPYGAEIQLFAQNYFSSLAQGNIAAAQFDLAVINVLQQQLTAVVSVYNAQLAAVSTNYNAVLTHLGFISAQATQNLTLDNDIVKGG